MAHWLVMIYLAGNNNLSEECVFALTEMKKAALSDNVTVMAQLDTSVHRHTPLRIKHGDTLGELNCELKAAQKRQVAILKAAERKAKAAGGTRNKMDAPAAAEAADLPPFAEVIFDFVNNCVNSQKTPVDHYLLILSGHGNGVLADFLSQEPSDSLNMVTLTQLIKKIKNDALGGRKLDILGLDSCLMSMAEIADSLKDFAKVMIGAEGFEPLSGWPYERVLTTVNEFASRPGGPSAITG